MTELELRQKVVQIVRAWEGGTRDSVEHYDILNTYNLDTPLPRGYAVKPGDPYCATTTSAAWIRAGIAGYTGKECSCSELMNIAKQKGTWVEADDHVPQLAEAVLYDWQDDGKGDNKGAPDHIGLVTDIDVAAKKFYVTEGNMNGGKIGRRTMDFNGRYIRGFICPDYAAIAKAITPAPVTPTPTPVPEPAPADPEVEAFRQSWLAYRKTLQDNDSSEYSAEAREWAVRNKLIVGNGKTADGEPNYMWEDIPTREQLVTVLYRFAKLIGKA